MSSEHPVEPLHLQYVLEQPLTLILQENFWSSSCELEIQDVNKQLFFRKKAPDSSSDQERVLYDTHSNQLLHIQPTNRFPTCRRTRLLMNNKQEMAQVSMRMFSCCLDLQVQLPTGEKLIVVGDLANKDLKIKRHGEVVVDVSRDFKCAQRVNLEEQQYFVMISPGVDIALMVAIVLCIDDIQQDKWW